MRNNKIELESELKQIINEIERLQVQQSMIVSRLQTLQDKVQEDLGVEERPRLVMYREANVSIVDNDSVELLRDRQRREREQSRNINAIVIPRVGDIARILNPSKGQESSDTVEGYYTVGKIKLLTSTGTQILRLPKNVHIIPDRI